MAQELSFVANLISDTDKLPESILVSFVRVKWSSFMHNGPLPCVLCISASHLLPPPTAIYLSWSVASFLLATLLPLGLFPIVGLTCFAAAS